LHELKILYGHDDAFACTVFGSGEENSVIHVRRSDIHIAAPNKKGIAYTCLIVINKKRKKQKLLAYKTKFYTN